MATKWETQKSKARKALIYGANYLARPLGNLGKNDLNLGHPFAAMGFGVIDIIAEAVGDKAKDNCYYRLGKLGGAAYFSALTIWDLVNFARGDYSNLKNFAFDLSMTSSLASDINQSYKKTKENPLDDIKKAGKGIAGLF